MCLAVPAQLVHVDDSIGTISVGGVTREVALTLVPHAQEGDWLLVHAGFAVQVIDEEEARLTQEAFRELEEREKAYQEGKIHRG